MHEVLLKIHRQIDPIWGQYQRLRTRQSPERDYHPQRGNRSLVDLSSTSNGHLENLERGTLGIVFYDNKGDRFYINSGLEQGLNLDSLNANVLNKSVTLHLAKVLDGMTTSQHIAQLAVREIIILQNLINYGRTKTQTRGKI